MAIELKWGAIISAAGFLWIVLEWACGLHDRYVAYHASITLLWIPVAMLLLVYGLAEKKYSRGGELSYRQGLLSTLLIAVCIGLLSPLAQWLYLSWINPDFFAVMIEHAMDRGKSPEQAAARFTAQNYYLQGTVAGVLGTLFTGAVAMIFLRSRGDAALEQDLTAD